MKMMTYISVISIVVLQWALVTASPAGQPTGKAAATTCNQAAEQAVKHRINTWHTLSRDRNQPRTQSENQQLKSQLDWFMQCDETVQVLENACKGMSPEFDDFKTDAELVAAIKGDCRTQRIQVATQTINRAVVLKSKQSRTRGEEAELQGDNTFLMSCRMDELEEAARHLSDGDRAMLFKKRARHEHAALTTGTTGTVAEIGDAQFEHAQTVMGKMINHWKGLAGHESAQIDTDLDTVFSDWAKLHGDMKKAAYAQVSADEREIMEDIMQKIAP